MEAVLKNGHNSSLLERLEFLEAIDGKNISLDDEQVAEVATPSAIAKAKDQLEKEFGDLIVDGHQAWERNPYFTPGAIACAMSHRLALKKVAEHPTAEWGLILEDDIVAAVPNADKVLQRLVAEAPNGWAMLYLGYHGGTPHPAAASAALGEFSKEDAEAAVGNMDLDVQACVQNPGLYAWAVRKDVAASALESFPLDEPLDTGLPFELHRKHHASYAVGQNSLLFYSAPSELTHDSDVHNIMSKMEYLDKLKEKVMSKKIYGERTKLYRRDPTGAAERRKRSTIRIVEGL